MRRFTLPPPPHTHLLTLLKDTIIIKLTPKFLSRFFQGKQSQHHDFQVATERRIKWKVREEEWNADNTHVGQNMILSSKYKPQSRAITFFLGLFHSSTFPFSIKPPIPASLTPSL